MSGWQKSSNEVPIFAEAEWTSFTCATILQILFLLPLRESRLGHFPDTQVETF